MISVSSVKDKLKNISNDTGKTMQDLFVLYGIERTIYRISISKYKNKFILKGGTFLYALFEGNYARITVDADFLAEKISNSIDGLKDVFKEIFSIKNDDALVYKMETLEVEPITELKMYTGVRITIFAYLDKTRIPISIDIGFGDTIYPQKLLIEYPTLLDMESPKINAYSIESAIAEKFEAIVSLGLANSRYKDFYDIYVLSSNYSIDGKVLQRAIKDTFKNRSTEFDDIVVFSDEFLEDKTREKRWETFINKKRAIIKLSFNEIIKRIKIFIAPIIDNIIDGVEYNMQWNNSKLKWEKVN